MVQREAAIQAILRAVCECLGWDIGTWWRIDRDAGLSRDLGTWVLQQACAAAMERGDQLLLSVNM